MVKQALIFASILSALVVAGLVGVSVYREKVELRRVSAELAAVRQSAELSTAQSTALGEQLTNSQARIEALLKEKARVTKAQEQMEGQMRSALQNKDVTISELKGSLTVNILDRVMFDSGEADLRPAGQEVLAQVAAVLARHPNRQVFVIGHTDNVPIRSTVFSRYPSNWELSTARATSAVRYLTEKANVDPKRIAAVGYGEFHPVADNATAAGRAKNRRIAIVILPENFNPLEGIGAKNAPPAAPAPVKTTVSAPARTNAPVIAATNAPVAATNAPAKTPAAAAGNAPATAGTNPPAGSLAHIPAAAFTNISAAIQALTQPPPSPAGTNAPGSALLPATGP